MDKIIIASQRADDLKSFCTTLTTLSGRHVEITRSVETLLDAVTQKKTGLVVIDGCFEGMADFSLVKTIVSINALIDTAILSDMDHGMFHDTTEGLGVLIQLSETPGQSDAQALLSQWRLVSGKA